MATTTGNAHYSGMKDTHTIDRLPHDQLWDQVIRREPGDFLYAVTTMGVYCRPGCPSPRPLRKNVRFFRNCGEAEAAGFRACRRCDPKGERARLAQAVVQDACAFIEAAEEIPSLDALATRSGYSRFHFLRMFRDHTGLTPRSYAEGVRAKRLHAALAGGARVADAVAEAGYGSESRVYEKTGDAARHDPGRAAARRARARSSAPPSPTARSAGCWSARPTRASASSASPSPTRRCSATCASVSRAPASLPTMPALAGAVRAVLDFLEEPKQALDLPLDLRGTAFQQRVWRTLCRIPPGETRSYAELAAMIGDPRAVRAVARSCARNPVSLAVPAIG